jgi:DNA-binding Xre family transcriptional regulator
VPIGKAHIGFRDFHQHDDTKSTEAVTSAISTSMADLCSYVECKLTDLYSYVECKLTDLYSYVECKLTDLV